MTSKSDTPTVHPEFPAPPAVTASPGASGHVPVARGARRTLRGWIDGPSSLFIGVALLLAALFWLLESGLHTWVFGTGPILDSILPTDPNELWMRLLTVGLFLAGGVLSAAFARRLVRLERRNRQLQEQLAAALTSALSEFLPICSYCKNIRNADEQWERVDAYLVKRTKATFSHGICPDCFTKYFPEDAEPPREGLSAS